MPLQPSSIYSCPLKISQAAFFFPVILCCYFLIGNRVRVKSLGMAPGLANARPPDSSASPGLTGGKMPRSSPGGELGAGGID